MSTNDSLYHLSARVPPELHAGLKVRAAVTGQTVQTLVAEALAWYLSPEHGPKQSFEMDLGDLSWLADTRDVSMLSSPPSASDTVSSTDDDRDMTPLVTELPFERDDYRPMIPAPKQPATVATQPIPIPVTTASSSDPVVDGTGVVGTTVAAPSGEFVVELRFRPTAVTPAAS